MSDDDIQMCNRISSAETQCDARQWFKFFASDKCAQQFSGHSVDVDDIQVRNRMSNRELPHDA